MVTDYLEGDLDPVDHAAIEHHLSLCDDCPAYVRQVRVMLELTRSPGSDEEAPAAFVDELVARFRAAPPRPDPGGDATAGSTGSLPSPARPARQGAVAVGSTSSSRSSTSSRAPVRSRRARPPAVP